MSGAKSGEEAAKENYESPPRTKIGKNISVTSTPLRTSPITPGSKVRKNLNLDSKKPLLNILSEKKRREHEGKSKADTPIEKRTKSALKDAKQRQEAKAKTHLKELYSLIRRKTGQLGGGGAGGAIYGEITQESFQRVVDFMCSDCDFGRDSVFLDVGAGLGKPSFHTAISPGVKLSLGVELIGTRWWQSMCLLNHCLDAPRLCPYAKKVFFAHANVMDTASFDPVTHVYSFNTGFPPAAMKAVAEAFHASTTTSHFICFDKTEKLKSYGFEVDLVGFVPTKMAGSGEQHRCYVYKRTDKPLREVTNTQPNATATVSNTPVERRTRSARLLAKKQENKSNDKPSPKKVAAKQQVMLRKAITNKSLEWSLVAPPTEVEYAPCVPHHDNYAKGMVAFRKGTAAYQKWLHDQIGLYRSFRKSRSTSNMTR